MRRIVKTVLVVLVLITFIPIISGLTKNVSATVSAPARKPGGRAKDPLSTDRRFAPADAVIEDLVSKGQIPGAVLLVGQKGKVIYRKAYGNRAIVPVQEPMTV